MSCPWLQALFQVGDQQVGVCTSYLVAAGSRIMGI